MMGQNCFGTWREFQYFTHFCHFRQVNGKSWKIFFAKTWPIICLTFAYIMIFFSDQTLSSRGRFSKLPHFHVNLTLKLKMAATSQVLSPDPNFVAQVDLHGG